MKVLEPKSWMSPIDAAVQLGVSSNTARKWADRGLLRAVRLPYGERRIDPASVTELLEAIAAGSRS